MDAKNTQSSLYNLLELGELSEAEQAQFMDEIGSLVMESAALRFLADLDDSEQKRFTDFIEKRENTADVLTDLLQEFPAFAEVIQEEMTTLEEDMKAMLEQPSSNTQASEKDRAE
jgi:hypothetical protein